MTQIEIKYSSALSSGLKALLQCVVGFALAVCTASSWAVTLYVSPTGSEQNPGSADLPLRSINAALSKLVAGDRVIVSHGVYEESLRTTTSGTVAAPIVLMGEGAGLVVVRATDDSALKISHPYYVVQNFVFDGGFSKNDVIRVTANGDGLIFRDNLVQDGAKDGIDLGSAAETVGEGFDYLENVVIDGSTFKNFLATDFLGNRIDAHGIVAGGVHGLTIKNTSVEMVSGDALQLANGNWDQVTVESVIFKNSPITEELASKTDFPEGINPGENAIDTKQDLALPVRSRLTVSRSEFHGWKGDLISNAAALNLKEKVTVTVDRCLFKDNEIALRLRGNGQSLNGADITVSNSIFYANEKALRLEDNLLGFTLAHNSFGAGNSIFVEMAGGGVGAGFNAANNVFLANTLPQGIPAFNNKALGGKDFVNVSLHDYRLSQGSTAVDTATMLDSFATDYSGTERPQGAGADYGAFERLPDALQMSTVGWLELIIGPALLLIAVRH